MTGAGSDSANVSPPSMSYASEMPIPGPHMSPHAKPQLPPSSTTSVISSASYVNGSS